VFFFLSVDFGWADIGKLVNGIKGKRGMYVLACIPIYGDRGRDLCCDPAGSQESAPELGEGCELAIKNAPLTGSLNNGRLSQD
jgi:hypothetical protein